MIDVFRCCFVCALAVGFAPAAEKSVLLIAGPPSHGPGLHEHPAGCEILAAHLNSSGLPIRAVVSEGWPSDAALVANADCIVIYGDGEEAHPARGRTAELSRHHAAGKGLAVLHYTLEPADAEMAELFDRALGGYFQVNHSVNPIWTMRAPVLAEHPVARGVGSFEIEDEFYFHIRLADAVVPVLSAVPPEDSLGADGPRSGNPEIRRKLAAKEAQPLAWVVESAGGARGFGFTGGHFHRNWYDENFRRLVVNGIAWTAGVDVPEGGVPGKVAETPVYPTIDEAISRDDLADVRRHLAADPENLRKGGRPNSRPPLEQAVLRNRTEIAIALVEAGAPPDGAPEATRTPLHLAVDRNNPQVIAALLKAEAKPNRLDQKGWTPLHHAAAKNQTDSVRVLLEGGADPMTLSELGGTPLHEAGASGGEEIIRLLLDHKVDPTVKSKEGVTALDLAKKYDNQPAIRILSGL